MEILLLCLLLGLVLILARAAERMNSYEQMDLKKWADILNMQACKTKSKLEEIKKKTDTDAYDEVISTIMNSNLGEVVSHDEFGNYAAMLHVHTDGEDQTSEFKKLIVIMLKHNVKMQYPLQNK